MSQGVQLSYNELPLSNLMQFVLILCLYLDRSQTGHYLNPLDMCFSTQVAIKALQLLL